MSKLLFRTGSLKGEQVEVIHLGDLPDDSGRLHIPYYDLYVTTPTRSWRFCEMPYSDLTALCDLAWGCIGRGMKYAQIQTQQNNFQFKLLPSGLYRWYSMGKAGYCDDNNEIDSSPDTLWAFCVAMYRELKRSIPPTNMLSKLMNPDLQPESIGSHPWTDDKGVPLDPQPTMNPWPFDALDEDFDSYHAEPEPENVEVIKKKMTDGDLKREKE